MKAECWISISINQNKIKSLNKLIYNAKGSEKILLQLYMNSSLKEGFNNPIKAEKFKKSGVKRPGSDLEPTNKKRESNGSDSCFAFNSEKGCNRSSGEACFKYGRWFKHQCSHILEDGSVCGASDHGNDKHP